MEDGRRSGGRYDVILDWVLSSGCVFFGRPRFKVDVVESIVGSLVMVESEIWGDFLEVERLSSEM